MKLRNLNFEEEAWIAYFAITQYGDGEYYVDLDCVAYRRNEGLNRNYILVERSLEGILLSSPDSRKFSYPFTYRQPGDNLLLVVNL
jgi:hypothetical protein